MMVVSSSLHRFFLLTTPFLVLLVTYSSAADDEGFSDMPGMNSDCPNFRCSSGMSPVPKSRSKFSSAGCGAMGGGMMMMGMGAGNEVYSPCCDLWHACYQTCGSSKKNCDDSFSKCSKQMCGSDEKCKESANLNGMMVGMGGCSKFNEGQYQACDCVVKDLVVTKRTDAIRYFYKRFSPENVDKARNLATKADSTSKMASLFKKLLVKYPDAIKTIEDPAQKRFEQMMDDTKKSGGDKTVTPDEEEMDDEEDDGMDHTTVEL